MGLGDDIMATGQAIKRGWRPGGVVIGRAPNKPRKSPMFRGLEWVNGPGAQHFMREGNGCRGYIDQERTTPDRIVVRMDYRAHPGELNLEGELRRIRVRKPLDRPVVAIHTHVKGLFSGDNRAWPHGSWVELVRLLAQDGYEVWQLDPAWAKRVPGAEWRVMGSSRPPRPRSLACPGLRESFALLSYADVLVCPEDVFHHAAAALRVPAVVLYGGRTPPEVMGYPKTERALTSREEWCGMCAPCDHCRAAMEDITPERVLDEVRSVCAL